MITQLEKERLSTSKHSIVVQAAKWGYSIKILRDFFDYYKLKYTYRSMRTTYYRAKQGWFPKTHIKPEQLKIVKQMFEDLPDHETCISLNIQGDYAASINNEDLFIKDEE